MPAKTKSTRKAKPAARSRASAPAKRSAPASRETAAASSKIAEPGKAARSARPARPAESAKEAARSPASRSSAEPHFTETTIIRGEAVEPGEPLPSGATHEIAGHDASGQPILKRKRFSIC